MNLLEVEPLDLGPGIKAIGLELTDPENNREPILGKDAAAIWSRVLPAVAGTEAWGLDFFSHLDRVRNYCQSRDISYRETSEHAIVIPPPPTDLLEGFFERFERERFGARAGGGVTFWGRRAGGRNSPEGRRRLCHRLWYLCLLRCVRF